MLSLGRFLLRTTFRVLFYWPGLVLATLALLYALVSSGAGDSHRIGIMADTARSYRDAPAGSVLTPACGRLVYPDFKPVSELTQNNCPPRPVPFAEAVKQEHRILLAFWQLLIAVGFMAEVIAMALRRASGATCDASVNAEGERSMLFRVGNVRYPQQTGAKEKHKGAGDE
jgi:hypothetical protein